VLDVAVGQLLFQSAVRAGRVQVIDDFLGDLKRW
jgi:hypothetical protein